MTSGDNPSDFIAFDFLRQRNHEAVFFCSDTPGDLRGIIAIHDTTLGPALGGCRIKSYANEQEALVDALRLSRAMTYKAAAAGLNLGGGKSVVFLNPGQEKTPALLKAFAERIALLGGNYIGAGDVGSDTRDLKLMRQYCPWIVGLDQADGGLGDSAILTALGVFVGLRAAVQEKLGRDTLGGLKVAVQGAGKVGFHLVGHLLQAGCAVVVADPDPASIAHVQEHYSGVKVCPPGEIYDQAADIFSPNAIGGVLTPETTRRLKAAIVAGGANNPLSDETVARLLHAQNILYTPDFVINAGGLMMVACELERLTFEQAEKRTRGIYDRTLQVFEYAKQKTLLPWDAARQMAVERIEAIRREGPRDRSRIHAITADRNS